MTSSIALNLEDTEVCDMRYSWLKDAIFNVKVLHKLYDINSLERYLSYILNIINLSVKRNIPLQTSYHIEYTKDRVHEREANSLAGFDVSGGLVLLFRACMQ
jgi:hypothetical protein